MDENIEREVQACEECQKHSKSPPTAPLHPWEWPESPWSRIHVDYAGPFLGEMFLIIVDAHSKWMDIYPVKSSTSQKIGAGTSEHTISISEGGIYYCRGGRGDPVFSTEDSAAVTIQKQVLAAVKLQHSWSQIFTGDTITLRCEIQGGEGKVWKYEWTAPNTNSPPTSSEYRISRVSVSHSGDYRCRGSSDYLLTGWSDAFTLTVSSSKPRATLTAQSSVIPAGGSVTLSCSVEGSAGWKFDWFRRDSVSSKAQLMRGNEANRVISVSQGGLYHCRGGRGDPVYYTEDSSDVTVQETLPSKTTVTLQPSWTQIYSGETVTVRCEIQGGEGAQWTYEWRAAKSNTPPTSNEYRIIRATKSDSGGYSCRGRRDYFLSEWSDIITLTVSYEPRPVLTVSPSWLSPGASVTLNCEVEHPSAGWSFYWYKAVPDLSEKSSSYELLPDGSGTAQDSYIIHGQTHTAGYVCRAGRGDPEYHTDHSQPKFVWSADVHSAASLTVSPDRVQHFTSDSVSLTCEGNFTEWRVRKFSEDGRLYSDCRRMTGSTCDINTSKSDTAVYWCESGSGEFSSAVNITVQNDGNGPILVSPVHPVTEGASVSLSCSLRTQKILSNVFFYHNDKLIQNDPRGELKISAVSKSDEGFYKCQYSGRESAQSWMSVKVTVSGADSSSSPVWLIVGLVFGVSLLIILLLLLYRCRTTNSENFFLYLSLFNEPVFRV
ncbi:Fc receptor-like protein 5 [Astatotilapia calliptera]|uniref:Fc receptor-like protein 5 n=1 Tax=Astatotilapia calliptera TaxID=8154 RepID=UPI000E41F383|nr:Fc receptor-like protein 5 [Astatotilapia calliptera]